MRYSDFDNKNMPRNCRPIQLRGEMEASAAIETVKTLRRIGESWKPSRTGSQYVEPREGIEVGDVKVFVTHKGAISRFQIQGSESELLTFWEETGRHVFPVDGEDVETKTPRDLR